MLVRPSQVVKIATILLTLRLLLPGITWAEISQTFLTNNSLSITEIQKYLVIAMGDDADNGRAFQMSNSEIGADREVLSTPSDPGFPTNGSFPNLLDVFDDRSSGGNDNRWNISADPDTVSVSGAGVVSPGEGVDWSGEVALTANTTNGGSGGKFEASNSLVFADTGIQGAISNPVQSASNSRYLDVGQTTPAQSTALALNNGATGNNNFTSLLSDISSWKTVIQGLSAEVTITSLTPFQNNEANNGVILGTSGNGLITTYGSSNDLNNDGVVVIDINLGGSDFNLTNLDWAIIANDGVFPIFRLRGGSNMVMNNVSILVDNSGTTDLGAIFYSGYEGSSSGDTVFNGGSNVILNGIGLWDLNAVGEGGGNIKTNININNAQGCAQFISQKVNFQNNRWNRCAISAQEPGSITIIKEATPEDGTDFDFTIDLEFTIQPFINEFHYDNQSTDVNEGVEIAGAAGTNLSGWSVVFYDGANGQVYDPTISLSGIIDNEGGGVGALFFARSDIQNGPDGIALVDPSNNVVQFISYEGSFAATNGPANGQTSSNVSVSEPSNSNSNNSLQLTGTGSAAGNFTWTGPIAHSRGNLNSGQTLTLPGFNASFTLDDEPGQPNDSVEQSITFDDLTAGDYTIEEVNLPAGWTLDSISCDGGSPQQDGNSVTVTVGAGDNITCTFENSKQGKIIVEKQTLPDGDPATFDFSGDIVATLGDGQTAALEVTPGAYSVVETVPAGWNLTDISCDNANSSGDTATATASFNVEAGETVTCTFENSKQGSITIIKDAVPNDAQDFTFTTDIPGNTTVTLDDDADNTLSNTVVIEVAPGTYNISESAVTGWDLTSATCSDGSPVSAIAVAPGEEVTCTFTNTKAGKIIVQKQTNPDGDTTADFTFSTTYDADGFVLSDGEQNDSGDIAPGTYSITETPATGWKLVSIICNSSSGGTEDFRAISLQSGETVTCTFTNRKQVSLTIIKEATPADGTNFSFLTTIPLHALFFLDDAAVDDNDGITDTFSLFIDPGNYTIIESAKDGWNLTGINCVTSDPNTGLTTVNNVAFLITSVGETVTCTFTNVKRGTITVVKDAVEETGQDFTINLGGDTTATATVDDANPDDNDGIDSDFTFSLPPGDYTLSEVIPVAWNLNSIVCTTDDDEDIVVTTNLAEIALDAGENVTCTFTNERKKATITIIKDANPADGTNFSFLTTIPAHNLFFLDDAAVDDNDGITDTATFVVFPGNYTILESVPGGWNLTGIECVTSDPATGITVVNNVAFFVAGGNEIITCTFTNVKRGSITIVKDATPEDGTDFSFTGELGDFQLDDDADGTLPNQRTFSVAPDTYTVSETVPADWNLASATCTDGSLVSAIEVSAGENVICTFYNVQEGGTITIVKDAVPDAVQDFGFTGSSPIGTFSLDDDAGVAGDGLLQNTAVFALPAGSYSVQESTVSGWDLVSIECTTADTGDTTSVDLSSGLVTIDLDANENITCTFTNVKRGTITVVKDAEPADGTNFTISVGGDGAGNIVLDDIEPQDGDIADTDETISFVPGTYTLTEIIPTGWNLASLVCSTDDPDNDVSVAPNLATIPLEAGENVTCTFTNVEESGSITIIKDAVPDDAQDFSFTGSDPIGSFSLDDDANVALPNQQTFAVVPGSYSFQEDSVSGWDLTAIDCQTNDLNDTTSVDLTSSLVTIDLDDGENITCTFSNVKRGKITVIKDAEPADGTDFTISVGGDGAGNILLDDIVPQDGDIADTDETISFVPGDYTLTELVPAGWNLASLICSTDDPDNDVSVAPNLATIPLEAGENVTCTFTNVRESGSITIIKDATPDDAQDFSFSAGDPINSFSLDDDADVTLPNQQTFTVVPGSYSFQEDSVPGWDLTAIDCQTNDLNDTTSADLSSSLLTVDLDDGENITCTFSNVKRGKITVVKDAQPDNNDNFTISVGGDGAGNIVLDDANPDDGDANQSSESILFTPGNYTLTELVPDGWNLTNLVCTTTDANEAVTVTTNLATINLNAGEEVTCVFTNTQRGSITIIKDAVPDDNQIFDFSGDLGNFSLVDNGLVPNFTTFSNLAPGPYSVSEIVPAGWDLTSLNCNDLNGSTNLNTATATINLDSGETVTCTFTNDPLPAISVTKTASPTSVNEPGGVVTFAVSVDNDSVEVITLDSLTDTVHGDLDGQGTCATGGTISVGGSYSCSFTATVSGNAGESETDVVTAIASDDEGNQATANDDATVTIADIASSILVTKTADPTEVAEPGGSVTFTVRVDNTSAVDGVSVDSLIDTIHGDLDGQGDCAVPQTIAAGGFYECTFSASVSGNAGDSETDVVTASGIDDDGNPVSDDDDATVTITDVPSSILVTKTADLTSVAEPGGSVAFSVRVDNTSAVDSVTIDSLSDNIHGDLDGQGDCAVPQTVAAGGFYECSLSAVVSGNAGDFETDVVTASGTDDDGNPVSDEDDATVTITDTLPDITVQKDNDANGDTTFTDNEQTNPGTTVTFQITITNNTDEEVTIDSISDSIYDLTGSDCASLTGTTLAANGSATCTFTGTLANQFNLLEVNEVTVVARDDEGNAGEAKDNSTVTTLAPGSITIIKEAEPEGNQVFNFSGTLGNFSLVDDGVGPGQETITFPNLGPGDYTIGEQVSNRWVLLSISCSSNQREPFSVAFPALEITIAGLQPGEAVTCTFTNNKPNFEEEPTTIYLPLIVK